MTPPIVFIYGDTEWNDIGSGTLASPGCVSFCCMSRILIEQCYKTWIENIGHKIELHFVINQNTNMLNLKLMLVPVFWVNWLYLWCGNIHTALGQLKLWKLILGYFLLLVEY